MRAAPQEGTADEPLRLDTLLGRDQPDEGPSPEGAVPEMSGPRSTNLCLTLSSIGGDW